MKKERVTIIGANGQLGSDLVSAFGHEEYDVTELTHKDISVEDVDSVHKVLRELKPDVILNTAAYHTVPRCEENPTTAFNVNSMGALNVARIAQEIGAVNVYFSTDYVFDGSKKAPYPESDLPNPLNVYANTKLSGEYYSLNYAPSSFVLRVSGLYGRVPCRAKGGNNFVTTMIKLSKEKPEVRVVNDEILTPTPTWEVAKETVELIKREAFGLYHLTCEGECSWYEFARVIFDTLKLDTPLHSCSVRDFPSEVKRPFYSVLQNKHLEMINAEPMPRWQDALKKFLQYNYL